MTVPAVIVTLHALEVISNRAARRKPALIEPMTAPSIIRDARRALEIL